MDRIDPTLSNADATAAADAAKARVDEWVARAEEWQSEAEALIQRDQVRRRRALVDAQERLSRASRYAGRRWWSSTASASSGRWAPCATWRPPWWASGR